MEKLPLLSLLESNGLSVSLSPLPLVLTFFPPPFSARPEVAAKAGWKGMPLNSHRFQPASCVAVGKCCHLVATAGHSSPAGIQEQAFWALEAGSCKLLPPETRVVRIPPHFPRGQNLE